MWQHTAQFPELLFYVWSGSRLLSEAAEFGSFSTFGGQFTGKMNGCGDTFRHPEGFDIEADSEQEAFSADLCDGGMLPGRDGFANGAFVLEGTRGELPIDHLAEDSDASGAGERTAAEG